MVGLGLAAWLSVKDRARTLIMVCVVAAGLTTYVILGAIMRDISALASLGRRFEQPWDLVAAGPGAHSIASEVRGIEGVLVAAKAYVAQGIMQSTKCNFVAFDEPDPFSTEYEAGGAPVSAEDVALTRERAQTIGVELGSEVLILPLGETEPISFRVSGIIASKSGNLADSQLSPQGAAKLSRDISKDASLLIVLDGAVSIDAVRSAIRTLAPDLTVTLLRTQYEGVRSGAGLAGVLVASMRSLILLVSAASVAALSYVSMRERARQLGVLRAVGSTRTVLLGITGFQALFAVLVGTAISAGLASLLNLRLQLQSASAWSSFPQDAGKIGLVVMIVVIAVSRSVHSRSIRSLLTDSWGK
jgi:hypothetical protein